MADGAVAFETRAFNLNVKVNRPCFCGAFDHWLIQRTDDRPCEIYKSFY